MLKCFLNEIKAIKTNLVHFKEDGFMMLKIYLDDF